MRIAPSWARDEAPDPVETASERLREDVARDKLYAGATATLPLNHERARIELTEERRVHAFVEELVYQRADHSFVLNDGSAKDVRFCAGSA